MLHTHLTLRIFILGNKTINITSSIAKLVRHRDICEGELHPVSSQIVLTDRCNLRCKFCVTKDKDKAATCSYKDIFDCLHFLKSVGCKGVEITGGGEPTLHKYFSEVVFEANRLGFDLGLVTNGTRLTQLANKRVLPLFDWVRVSLNSSGPFYKDKHGADFFDRVIDGLKILDREAKFYGISYIRSSKGLQDLEELLRYINLLGLKNLAYFRVARDVTAKSAVVPVNTAEVSMLAGLLPNVFLDVMESRSLQVPDKCIMYKLKPCFDASGVVYPCCISQYTKTNGIGSLDVYRAVLAEKYDYEPDTSKCKYCIYKDINNAALFFSTADVKNPNFI